MNCPVCNNKIKSHYYQRLNMTIWMCENVCYVEEEYVGITNFKIKRYFFKGLLLESHITSNIKFSQINNYFGKPNKHYLLQHIRIEPIEKVKFEYDFDIDDENQRMAAALKAKMYFMFM